MDLRKTLRVARWEVLKGRASWSRRTVLLVVLSLVVSGGVGAAVSQTTVTPDAGLYEVGVDRDSPYYGPVAEDPTFVAVDPDGATPGEDVALLVDGGEIRVADTAKGRAALSELRSSVRTYNDRRMDAEADEAAAFPVDVRVVYVSRGDGTLARNGGTGGDPTGGDGPGGGDGTGGDTTGDATPSPTPAATPAAGGDLSVPNLGGQPLFSTEQSGRPGDITPPFPLGALVLAFLFVVPLNFVIQAYGASVLRERIDRRGELLLVAPLSRGDVVAGKTLPYLVGATLVAAVTAVAVGGGVQSVAAVVPLALLFLSATFVAAMFARSFKELTFLTVSISVGLTSYAFVPAIFSEVTPIAFISPLTVVVKDLLGQGVPLGRYLFSTGPLYLASGVLFVLGLGVYREEDMFTQRPVHLKALDALAGRLRGAKSVALLTAALLPFVFLAELLVIALLFALPVALSLPLLFVAIGVVEEAAKGVHVYAGFVHRRFPDADRAALAVGLASGVGFFLAEKATVVAQVVGLPDLVLGRAAFTTTAGLDVATAALLLLAPLALHTVTASVSALGARRGARPYLAAYGVAVAIHVAYNLGVVGLVA